MLFAEEVVLNPKKNPKSSQSQCFKGRCIKTGERVVIKQFAVSLNYAVMVKELAVFRMFTTEEISDDSDPELLKKIDPLQDLPAPQQEKFQKDSPFNLINQVPEILAFAYTDKIGEIKMRDCGLSLEDFIQTTLYQEMNGLSRVCFVFDMMRQIIRPL